MIMWIFFESFMCTSVCSLLLCILLMKKAVMNVLKHKYLFLIISFQQTLGIEIVSLKSMTIFKTLKEYCHIHC